MIITILVASVILFVIVSIADELAAERAEERFKKLSPEDQDIAANYEFLA